MELLPGDDPGFVKIIHPETGGVAEVHQDGLGQFWLAGWVPLTVENAPPGDAPPGVPAAMTEAQVAEHVAGKAASAKSVKSAKE